MVARSGMTFCSNLDRASCIDRTMRPTPTMSLLRASPRSFEMPTISSSRSTVPLASTSSVANRSSWSSSETSRERRITWNSLNVRSSWKNSRDISISDTSQMSLEVMDCLDRTLSWYSGVFLSSLVACSLQTNSTSSFIFDANMFWSSRRCFFWWRLLYFAAAMVFSTYSAAMTLNSPKYMSMYVVMYSRPYCQPWPAVTSTKMGLPSTVTHSEPTTQRKSVKKEPGRLAKDAAPSPGSSPRDSRSSSATA
mmetsp:Transcript_84751/g.240397  ORF Transcript_84751/g.240397 Transcript_84751/m.240397 type:complete len:251 (-) Transcript_84751:881-1633(-)